MTYHLCAEDITKNCIVPSLTDEEKDDLLTRGALPPESTARDRHCVMCPVRRGSPKLLPCCICYNWCHPGCSYQTHLGRVCPSAGLVWMQGASQSADVGVYNDLRHLPHDAPEPRPTISLFEHWEEGAHLPVTLDARNYSFPSSLVIPFMWIHSPASLSLSDAINNVSLHGEKRAWGQASQINLVPGVNYPNQPRSDPDSHLSDPLTYWWGVTLCPPELNDVALAETVGSMMRLAAIREIHLNAEVNKPSLAAVLEYKGLRMECSVESTPHEEACIYSSAYDGGKLLTEFEETGREMAEGEGIDEVPTRSQEYATTNNPWPRDDGKEAKRRQRRCTKESHVLPGDKETGGTSMVSHHVQHPQRHMERVIVCILSQHGARVSLSANQRAAQPYRLQKANKSDGQWSRWASDVRQSQPDQWSDSSAKWVSSAGDDSSWKRASEWEGSQWSIPTKWTLKGSDYDIDREWHLRNMRYGEGWAYDSSRSHYKRAKPTGTDPEDDRKEDSALPIGSTSKTYDPQSDYTMWQRKDGNQTWRQSSSSGDQWKPRLRYDRDLSSVAGDASEASAATHRLKSIYESDGDAVKGPRSDESYWR